jgi:hypothetical protein
VAIGAVAAGLLETRDALEPAADSPHSLAVPDVGLHRIGLVDADRRSAKCNFVLLTVDIATRSSSFMLEASSHSKQKYSIPIMVSVSFGTTHGLEARKFEIRRTATPGRWI